MTEPLIDLSSLPDLIGDDDTLKNHLVARVTDLIDLAFDRAEEQLTIGDPATQAAILKTILPLVVKMRDRAETSSEDIQRTRDEVVTLFKEMGAGLGATDET